MKSWDYSRVTVDEERGSEQEVVAATVVTAGQYKGEGPKDWCEMTWLLMFGPPSTAPGCYHCCWL